MNLYFFRITKTNVDSVRTTKPKTKTQTQPAHSAITALIDNTGDFHCPGTEPATNRETRTTGFGGLRRFNAVLTHANGKQGQQSQPSSTEFFRTLTTQR